MYTLHYYPANANAAPHMLLEELGAKYELALVDVSPTYDPSGITSLLTARLSLDFIGAIFHEHIKNLA